MCSDSSEYMLSIKKNRKPEISEETSLARKSQTDSKQGIKKIEERETRQKVFWLVCVCFLFFQIISLWQEKNKKKEGSKITKLPAPTVQKPLTTSTRTRPVGTSPDKTRDSCWTGSSFLNMSIVFDTIFGFKRNFDPKRKSRRWRRRRRRRKESPIGVVFAVAPFLFLPVDFSPFQ